MNATDESLKQKIKEEEIIYEVLQKKLDELAHIHEQILTSATKRVEQEKMSKLRKDLSLT
ncbi:MAG: hypothetical protein HY001_03025 [Candidatus Portnoybacteria bacterium]|nr:hypothetical protein [Candidatus Portnoybacteria bacterium]